MNAEAPYTPSAQILIPLAALFVAVTGWGGPTASLLIRQAAQAVGSAL
ncbi:hypothetical protein ACEUZ9_002195 [Paracoccus litorisediminis]